MTVVLDGRETSAKVAEELKAQVEELKRKGVTPTLALILVGTDQYSARYVNMKAKRAEEVGVATQVHQLEQTNTEEVVKLIRKLNADPKVHGVMVQLPVPKELNELAIVEAIAPGKDVDGIGPTTFGKILMGEECHHPAGIVAIMELLKRYNIDPEGKHWVIAGYTNIIGKPMAALLMNMKVSVSLCRADDPKLPEIVRQGDVIVTELYRKHAINADMVKRGVVVIDNGNNYEGKKVFGDVDTEGVSQVASAITPVPGGVGPLLITMLLRNTVKAASH